jgi:hypothetical protein
VVGGGVQRSRWTDGGVGGIDLSDGMVLSDRLGGALDVGFMYVSCVAVWGWGLGMDH